MQSFSSLSDFDDFVATLGTDPEGEADRLHILADCFLTDPAIVTMPDDPFSTAYMACVLQIHATISGRAVYDSRTMEHTPFHVEEAARRPAPYVYDGEMLGQYLESYGHMIRKLQVRPGTRVLELGCGDAQISLHLARMGCDVTVVDIEPDYVAAVKRQAEMSGIKIEALQGDFLPIMGAGQFDRIFFYQSFHHALHHNDLLAALGASLTDDGFVLFGPEPIIDPAGPWARAVPYPWGPRLDGLSLRAMRVHGWMELGFHESYFDEALRRAGLTVERVQSRDNPLVSSIVARRRSAAEEASIVPEVEPIDRRGPL